MRFRCLQARLVPSRVTLPVQLRQQSFTCLRIILDDALGDRVNRSIQAEGMFAMIKVYSMVCFSAAMRALLPENASPYLIIDLIPKVCISAL